MRYVFSLLGWLLTASAALATHLIGGYIQATPVAGQLLTYQFTVTVYFNGVSGAAATQHTEAVVLCFGDNTPSQSARRLTLMPLATDRTITVGTFAVNHQFNGPGTYTVTLSQLNRSPTRNITADEPLSLRTTLQVGGFANQTPTLVLPATGLTFSNRQPVTISLAGVDPDGDSLSYSLAMPLTSGITNSIGCQPIITVPAYQFPNDLLRTGTYRLNARTGQLIWSVPTELGTFTAALTVLEWRAGVVISQTQHEIILTIVDRGGTPVTPPPYEPAQIDLVTALPDEQPDQSGLHLTLAPNPVVDVVRIKLTNKQPYPTRLTLLDSQGRTQQTIETMPLPDPQHYQLDLSQHPAGTYLIRAESNGRQVVRKLVKP